MGFSHGRYSKYKGDILNQIRWCSLDHILIIANVRDTRTKEQEIKEYKSIVLKKLYCTGFITRKDRRQGNIQKLLQN